MSCGAGPTRRASHAIARRGTSRHASHVAKRKTGTRTTVTSRRSAHGIVRQILQASRRPPNRTYKGKRSKASLTAGATARKHARMTARATASAHARATARAHALAKLQADRAARRRAYQAYIACIKKARKSAASPSGTAFVWRPSFRGRQSRKWGKGRLW